MKKTKLVIQQAENGTYFTQVSKGVRPDGKRNRRMFTGSTEDEVYFKATKWLKGIEEEERNPYTVREAMLQFIDSRSRVLEPTTLCCYREMLRNKLQYIMDIKIEDLTARDIQIAINVDAQRLGYKSIKNAVGFLRAVLNANDITIKMGSIRLPKKEVRERRLPSADVIYAIVKGTSSELPVLLAMGCHCALEKWQACSSATLTRCRCGSMYAGRSSRWTAAGQRSTTAKLSRVCAMSICRHTFMH